MGEGESGDKGKMAPGKAGRNRKESGRMRRERDGHVIDGKRRSEDGSRDTIE